MADERNRKRQREAQVRPTDEDAVLAAALSLARTGDPARAAFLAQPFARKRPDARFVVVIGLPPNAHAFCVYCGNCLPLGEDGWPKNRSGKACKKMVCCIKCRPHVSAFYATRARTGVELVPQVPRSYCGRCGRRLLLVPGSSGGPPPHICPELRTYSDPEPGAPTL